VKTDKQAKKQVSSLMSSTASACLELAADTSASPKVIPYKDAVRQGKEILSETSRGQLRLGEIADKLEPKYKDRTLAKFAADIDVAPCTLGRYRDVWRAWKDTAICAPGRKSFPPYAVLRELATLPNREEIIRDNPDITKRAAHDLVRNQGGAAKEKLVVLGQEDDWLKHSRGWFKDFVAVTNEVGRKAAGVVDLDNWTPQQRADLREVIDPALLEPIGDVGRMLIATEERLKALWLDDDPSRDTAGASPRQMAAE
jgi:hypothetical protein